MAKQSSDVEVKNFMQSVEFRSYITDLKAKASQKKLTVSPNDIPEVKMPLEPEQLQRLFSKPFLTR